MTEYVDVDARELLPRVTMTIRLKHLAILTWRVRVGLWFVKLGVRITGMRVRVKE